MCHKCQNFFYFYALIKIYVRPMPAIPCHVSFVSASLKLPLAFYVWWKLGCYFVVSPDQFADDIPIVWMNMFLSPLQCLSIDQSSSFFSRSCGEGDYFRGSGELFHQEIPCCSFSPTAVVLKLNASIHQFVTSCKIAPLYHAFFIYYQNTSVKKVFFISFTYLLIVQFV